VKKRKFSNLFKKLKRTNSFLKYTFFISVLLYLVSIILLTRGFVLLEGIETLIRIFVIITLYLYFFVYLVFGLALLISKKHKGLLIFSIITLLFSICNTFIYHYINKTYNIVDDISKDKIIYTTNLIKLKENNEEIITVGLISNENDIEGFVLPQEYMATNNLKYKIESFDTDLDLLSALYKKEVDAIFITANYVVKYADTEDFEDIGEKTIVIDTYSKKMDNQDTALASDKDITEPFSVLLLGVDSKYDGLENNAAFNGDSIMMITFNPKTLSATVFSLPRDTYVPIACNNNKSNKINSASAYGTKCMIDTVQNLTGIPIDYYVKINFKGVVALVEALGGITVDIEKPDFNKNWGHDCDGMVCEQNSNRDWGDGRAVYIPFGENQELNGEQALAYARNRHQWAASDFKRIEHQQAVVTAIANKAKTINSVNTFYKVLNAVANNIDTNMSTKQMLNFYNVGKNILLNNNFEDDEFIHIQRTYLSGYDLSVYQGSYRMYTFQYYEESLDEIVKAMKENLEIEKPELIKTFNFSVNEEYVVPVIGKTYSAVKRNEVLPDFNGKSIQYLEDWAQSRNISIEKSLNSSNSCVHDSIINQSVHSGTLVSSISSIKVDVCKNITVDDININNVDDNNGKDTSSNENNNDTQKIESNKNEENDNQNNSYESSELESIEEKEIDKNVENMIN